MRYTLLTLFLMLLISESQAQLNIGFVSGGDLYQRYVNPLDNTGTDRSAGSAIINGNMGVKVYAGLPDFSLSVESYFNSGTFALNIQEYKGLGAVSFPVLAKLNFNGLSGLRKIDKSLGWSIGGGLQWSRTEWYGLSLAARDAGVERNYFRNYVFEISFGSGNRNKVQEFFVRYGVDPVAGSNVFNIGLNTTYSLPYMKLPDFNLKPDSDESEEAIKI